MNLDDLRTKLARDPDDEEEEADVCAIKAAEDEGMKPTDSEDTNEPSTIEEDLTEALDLLEQALLMMEGMKVRRKRIVYIPQGMQELMEEMSELLDQYEIQR